MESVLRKGHKLKSQEEEQRMFNGRQMLDCRQSSDCVQMLRPLGSRISTGFAGDGLERGMRSCSCTRDTPSFFPPLSLVLFLQSQMETKRKRRLHAVSVPSRREAKGGGPGRRTFHSSICLCHRVRVSLWCFPPSFSPLSRDGGFFWYLSLGLDRLPHHCIDNFLLDRPC